MKAKASICISEDDTFNRIIGNCKKQNPDYDSIKEWTIKITSDKV